MTLLSIIAGAALGFLLAWVSSMQSDGCDSRIAMVAFWVLCGFAFIIEVLAIYFLITVYVGV